MALLSLGGVCLLLSCLAAAAGNDVPVATMMVKEDSDIVLDCSLGSDSIRQKMFDWKKDGKRVFIYDPRCPNIYDQTCQGNHLQQFKERVTYFNDRLDSGNASIKIQSATLKDSGNYTCIYVDQSQGSIPRIMSRISLTVDCILKDRTQENIAGACPEPVIYVNQTWNVSNLKCKIKGAFPQPTIEWQDGTGRRLSGSVVTEFTQDKEGRFYITEEFNVTQSGTYRCVAKQSSICHQVQGETSIQIASPEASTDQGYSTSLVIGLVVVIVILCVIVILGAFCYCRKDKKWKPIKSSNGGAESKSLRD